MLITNFINLDTCNQMADTLEKTKGIDYTRDIQITNETTLAYYKKFQHWHFELTERVSNIFNKTLIPTNDYSRIYTKGAFLEPHHDDPHCEYSVTLNLRNIPESNSWSFFHRGLNGTVEYKMTPGDAVFYIGPLQLHWREELTYDKCYQTFLHWVDLNGTNADLGIKNYKDFL